ncbi:MAG: hypothetical protein AAGD11_14170 [Planctomycetota bacterium]
MPFSRSTFLLLCFAMLTACVVATRSHAYGVVAPSTFASIQVQGEDPGTEFDDWSEVPIAYTDNDGVADNPGGFIDINTIQVANDNDNIYIHVDLLNTTSVPLATLYLAFDLDNDLSTGHDLFTLGAIGSEFGYQTDFPFQQDDANFNTGVAGVVEFGGDYIGLGLTFPFFDENGVPQGTAMEWAIPRDIAAGPVAPGTPVFTGDTFTFIAYTDLGAGDLPNNSSFEFEAIEYTLAASTGTPGDFDGDDDVDGDDFLDWQRELGVSLDAADLADWQSNYGPGTITAASAVPEPGSLALIICALIAATGRRN